MNKSIVFEVCPNREALIAAVCEEERIMMFYMYQDPTGRWLWRLETPSGRELAHSATGFERKEDCRADIQLVKDCRLAQVHVRPLLKIL